MTKLIFILLATCRMRIGHNATERRSRSNIIVRTPHHIKHPNIHRMRSSQTAHPAPKQRL